MKSKLHSTDPEVGDGRRGGKTEFSPVRTSSHGRSSNSRLNNTKSSNLSVKVSGGPGGSSHSPASTTRTGSVPSSGAGRTPQTKRRELSLTQAEKNSPNGSPRNVNKTLSGGNGRKPGTNNVKSKSDNRDREVTNTNNEESSRKSSNSSQDSGIGRESKLSRGDRTRSGQNLTKSIKNTPIIRTSSPDRVDLEVSNRKRFEELCDIKNIELGMVKVPPDILEDLINKDNIEKFYEIDEIPVAR